MFKHSALVLLLVFSIQALKFSHSEEKINHDVFVVQTKSPRYYYNEAERKGECSLSGMCDGMRKCSHQGKCVGVDRPAKAEDYFYDESITQSRCPVAGDYNFPIADYFCNALRKCVKGQCTGSQR